MSKLKSGVLAAGGIAIGIVTLRKVRSRRKTPQDEVEEAVEGAKEEFVTATDHAVAAAEHASVAAEKALEQVRHGSEKTE